VIIATPDFRHSENTVACLEAGLHVYCEKEMSNTLEGAKAMVEAAKRTGKLLQIGHQRRSNPRYRFVHDKIINNSIDNETILGQITTINGQWNRSAAACKDLGWPEGTDIPADVLKKYGYKDMNRFMNWRWYKGMGGGPVVDLGSHQIDIYSWFLGDVKPKSVMASGGIDYWKDHEWYDNVMAIYEFETKTGLVRAFYQTLTTSGSGGYYEKFMGTKGTLEISEGERYFNLGREVAVHDKDWDRWAKKGIITKVEKPKATPEGAVTNVMSSPLLIPYDIHSKMDQPFHQPHLVNFFDSIRGKATLNCPAKIGYETAVMVLKVNDAVAAGKKLTFSKEEFEV
jgi:predicted dehydrogenase